MTGKRCLRIIRTEFGGTTGDEIYQTEDGQWWKKLSYWDTQQTWAGEVGQKVNGNVCFTSGTNNTW